MAGKIALNNPKRIIPTNEYSKIESQAKGSSITPVSSRIKKAANELIKKYIIKDPKAPKNEVDGQIIHVFGGVRSVSQWNVVVINRGDREGMEVGDVLAIFSKGEVVKDRNTNERIQLPDERRGIMMVFRTFEKVSYGLILRGSGRLEVSDAVRNP